MNYMTFVIWWLASTWFGLLSQSRYSAEWDRRLNDLIDQHGRTAKVDYYTATLGSVEVWIANELYAFGHEGLNGRRRGYKKYDRPSLRTMHRLYLCCEWHRDQQ